MTTAGTPPTQRSGADAAGELSERQHLATLSILYWVFAGLSLVFGCIGVVYMAVGGGIALFLAHDAAAAGPNAPPPWVLQLSGFAIAGIAMAVAALQVTGTVLLALTARFIATRRNRMFCLVVAGLACLSVPLGTALGIYTFVILTRPGVIARFGGRRPTAIGP